MKQNYYVAMKIEARYYVDVEANDVEEAKRIAKSRFANATNDEIRSELMSVQYYSNMERQTK